MRSRPLALMTRLADCLKPTAQIGAQPSGSETPLGAFPPPRPETHISIPMRELTEDTTRADAARTRGQFLARQDMWDTLLHEIHQADMARATTGQGLPVAELLAFGARTDVVQATDTAIRDGCACDDPALTAGINALEALRHDLDTTPDTAPYLAAVLAQAHLDIGWAWRGNDWRDGLPEDRRPPARMVANHIWAMSHGVVELFARNSPGTQSPFPPEDLLETGIGVYLRGLGLIPPDE